MLRDAFVLMIQKELCHPGWAPAKRFSGHNVFVLEKRFEGRCKARAHFNIAHQVLLIYSYYYQKLDFREYIFLVPRVEIEGVLER